MSMVRAKDLVNVLDSNLLNNARYIVTETFKDGESNTYTVDNMFAVIEDGFLIFDDNNDVVMSNGTFIGVLVKSIKVDIQEDKYEVLLNANEKITIEVVR